MHRAKIFALIITIVIVVVIMTVLRFIPKSAPPETLWRYQTGWSVVSSPALGDIDGDGSLEVIVGSGDNYVYAIDSDGTLLWRFGPLGVVDSSPALGDIDGDNELEVIVGSYLIMNHNYTGYVYAIDSDGTLLWNFEADDFIDSSPALGDIDGDNELEVIVGCYDEYVYAIDSNGTLLWKFKTGGLVYSSPALGDIDLDGALEVIVGSYDNYVYVIDSDGTLLWKYPTGDVVTSSPALGDIDKDVDLEVIVGSCDHYIYAIKYDGTLLWKYPTGDAVVSSPALGDIDGDNELEVVVGSRDHYIYAINSDGTLLWSYPTGDCVISSPALGDVDGDNELEVVVGSYDGYVYAIDSDGTLLWKYPTGDFVASSPALGDIDEDDELEVIIGSSDDYVYALNVNGKRVFWEGLAGVISSNYIRTRNIADIDPDSDMLSSYSESLLGTDPHDWDSDDDDMPDGWEVAHSLKPLTDDSNGDKDHDGWTNIKEYIYHGNPCFVDAFSPLGIVFIIIASSVILVIIIIVAVILRGRMLIRKYGFGLYFYRKFYKDVIRLDEAARKVGRKEASLEDLIRAVENVKLIKPLVEYIRDRRFPRFSKRVARYYDRLCADVMPKVSSLNLKELCGHISFADAKILLKFVEEVMNGRVKMRLYSDDELTGVVKEISEKTSVDPMEVCKKGFGIKEVMEGIDLYRRLGKEIGVKREAESVFEIIDRIIKSFESAKKE